MSNNLAGRIFVGDNAQHVAEQQVTGHYVDMLGDVFYKIENVDAMAPFFMSIVSSSNHWLFISSTGGLSAGRDSAERALFPYYTEDKLTENSANTGNKTIMLATRGDRTSLWEPFSTRQQGAYRIQSNLYKNVAGTALIFEEINHSLGLACRYAWRTSDRFGFIKTSWLVNTASTPCQVTLLDGLVNLLPANVTAQTQMTFSCLLDAYKRSELLPDTGLGIFALNSILSDLAEPSESLLATAVMQVGLKPTAHLLSTTQLDQFRAGKGVAAENEVRGKRCAYLVQATLDLPSGAERSWHLVADVCQDSAAIVRLNALLRDSHADLIQHIERDIQTGNTFLQKIVAATDGLQVSQNPIRCATHFANVMFNGMRGGVFADQQYMVESADFVDFINHRNRQLLSDHAAFFADLPAQIGQFELRSRAEAFGAADLVRLCHDYLPLWFSRRHGDPSRPWNRFAINIKKADGSRQLDYEGNWRDIFQNWEALAYAYPEYIESMIGAFLNATTPDGYNPYRITRNGIDWEAPEPGNPWANIGYWSDHQIIYLQKLMEISAAMHPGKLQASLTQPVYSIANVPYRIKPYAELLKDSSSTIDFDHELEREIKARVRDYGSDGKLVTGPNHRVLHASLTEKWLTLLLAKLVNFCPEGGIWMNTQRPEWNDANNALVGKGLSVVTLCYLRRFIVFYSQLLQNSNAASLPIAAEVHALCTRINAVLARFQDTLTGVIDDTQRRAMMDALGQAGSDYRWGIYRNGFTGETAAMPASTLLGFLALALRYVEHSLRANQRGDGLYHAYNILHIGNTTASVSHLVEMLEGQVAILSSGMLSGAESLTLVNSLRHSQLYEPAQHSYILYPDKPLTPFLDKNNLAPSRAGTAPHILPGSHVIPPEITLLTDLVDAGDRTLIVKDDAGQYHFSAQLRNGKDVARILATLARQPRYADQVNREGALIEVLFESVFHHNEFTGRSGSFFAYEGLGSIYWHMVSKLILAVQETIVRASGEPSAAALSAAYADMLKGQSYNKTPAMYGAFPTDPYSHTPKDQGARQPGMTGLVKEEILIRLTELGVTINNGCVSFNLQLLDHTEFLHTPATFTYWRVDGQQERLPLQAGALAYTLCQVPVIVQRSGHTGIEIHYSDGHSRVVPTPTLDADDSRHLFLRDGVVHHLVVGVLV